MQWIRWCNDEMRRSEEKLSLLIPNDNFINGLIKMF